jgi:uncharacterized protein DUF4345
MGIALQILLGLVALICFAGGMNLLIKGAGSFLPKTLAAQAILDNLFRFLAGIYFGLGFLMTWVVFHFQETHELIYFIGIVVLCSGLGRLYSRIRVGAAGTYYDSMMILEIVLGVSIILLQYFR